MAWKTVPCRRDKKPNRDSTEVYSTNLSRTRLYWLCENWERKDCSIRSAGSSETLWRSLRDICCRSHSHKVNICYVGNHCNSSGEDRLLNVLRFLAWRFIPFSEGYVTVARTSPCNEEPFLTVLCIEKDQDKTKREEGGSTRRVPVHV